MTAQAPAEERHKNIIPHSLTKEELSMYFEMPIKAAAQEIGVCTTILKKICRKNGIPRWPYRKIQSINKAISSLESQLSSPGENRINKSIASLQKKKELIITDPGTFTTKKRKRSSLMSDDEKTQPASKKIREKEEDDSDETGETFDSVPLPNISVQSPLSQSSPSALSPDSTTENTGSNSNSNSTSISTTQPTKPPPKPQQAAPKIKSETRESKLAVGPKVQDLKITHHQTAVPLPKPPPISTSPMNRNTMPNQATRKQQISVISNTTGGTTGKNSSAAWCPVYVVPQNLSIPPYLTEEPAEEAFRSFGLAEWEDINPERDSYKWEIEKFLDSSN